MLVDLNELKNQISEAIARLKAEQAQHTGPDLEQYVAQQLKQELFSKLTKLGAANLLLANFPELRLPPAHIQADLAVSLFDLAKFLQATPEQVSAQLAAHKVEGGLLREVSIQGGFVNLQLDRQRLYELVLSQVGSLGPAYGEVNLAGQQVAVVEYSSPNIAKPIGIGHLRATVIGQALANLYKAVGFVVIKENYLGDWGAQFGKLLYAYQQWGTREQLAIEPIGELKKLYVRFHQQAEQDHGLLANAAQLYLKLEEGQEELVALWREFRELSIRDFKKTYAELGVHFDIFSGESYFMPEGEQIVAECLSQGACQQQTDSKLVSAEVANLPSFLLRKSDGSTLYITRDLALIRFRVKQHAAKELLYVVGNEQELNFRQLFALAAKLGYLPAQVKAKHIGFGLVLGEDGKKMSTRKGKSIDAQDLLQEAVDKALAAVKQKNPKLSGAEQRQVAQTVGIGAMIYNDLRQSRERSISFDWSKMLNFEAGSAAYLQYSCVRVKSILAKLASETTSQSTAKLPLVFEHQLEFELARLLALFPQVIILAQRSCEPHHLCTYLEQLAQLFNSFYAELPVLQAKTEQLRLSRTALIKSVLQVLQNGLAILNIKVPEKM